MKKHLFLGSVLLTVFSTFSQTTQSKPGARQIADIRTIMNYKYGPKESSYAPKARQQNSSSAKPSGVTSASTWQSFTSSMNIFGSSNSYVKPLQWNDELNAVTFMHRKSPSYVSSPPASANAANGTIVSMISTDCGLHWDSTCMWVNDTHWGRYPSGAIYNPPSNTTIDNAYMVGSGPTTEAGSDTWMGNYYVSKKIGAGMYTNAPSTVANAVQYMPGAGPYTANLGRHDFSAFGFSATDDGKMRVLAGITDHTLSPEADTAIMLVTGVFNNGVFDWSGLHFTIPVTTDGLTNARNFVSRPMMAWNEQGTVGYIVVMGALIGATGSNAGYQPIVYKTIDAGQSWSRENGIDFNGNAFNDVKDHLQGVESDSTLKVPNFYFGEGMDCIVDANNKLHLFTTIIAHTSNHPDSLNFIYQFKDQKYLWRHDAYFHPYLYDFIYDGTNAIPAWSHIVVDSMSSEAPSDTEGRPGYDFNPWDPNPQKANDKFKQDARLQMSRTANGDHIVYTWSESDIAFTDEQTHWNSLPNIKARLLDVSKGMLNPLELNLTLDVIGVSSHASCHFVSPKCKLESTSVWGDVLTMPITVSNSQPYEQLGPNTHWYSCASLDFRFDGVGIAENTLNSTQNSYLYPNPAKNNAVVSIDLKDNSLIQIKIYNLMGQEVKTIQQAGAIGNNTINCELSGLASGLYMVKVKVDEASSTKKLIIE